MVVEARISNQCSEIRDRSAALHEYGQRQRNSERPLRLVDKPHGQQRVAAHIEEVGVDIGDGHAEELHPQLCDATFHIVARTLVTPTRASLR